MEGIMRTSAGAVKDASGAAPVQLQLGRFEVSNAGLNLHGAVSPLRSAKDGAAEVNRTLDPVLTKDVLYH
jgi:hypothetical protein